MKINLMVTIFVTEKECKKIKSGISSDDANWLNTLSNCGYVKIDEDHFDEHIYTILDKNKVFYKLTRAD